MKTTLPILLLLFLVSCSHTPPAQKFSQPPADVQAESQMVVKAEPLYEGPTAVVETNAAVPAMAVPAVPITNRVVGAEAAAPALSTNLPAVQNLTPRLPGVPGSNAVPTVTVAEAAPTSPAPAEQMIPAGMIDFRNTPLEQVLQVYAELVNRTLLRPAALPAPQVTLKTQTQLTKSEAIQALDAVLGMNGITMINVSDKFVKAVPQPQALTEGARTDTRSADQLPDFGPFVTHVVQLKYVKPTVLAPTLTPFAKMNSILPIDDSQILVIRDYTENVKRMLEMIERVDIAVPAEYVSEVIPIKYAKASEIADALNSLSGGSGGGGTSIGRSSGTTRPAVGSTGAGARPGGIGGYSPGSPMGQNTAGGIGGGGAAAPGGTFSDRLQQIIRKASTSGDLQILGQTKMIADERSNSLLIFATRQDLDMIKNVVSKLDVVLSQVLIETVIMDVSVGNSLNYGVSAGQHPKTNSLGTVGGVYNNTGSSSPLSTLSQFFSGSGGSNISGAFPASSGLSYFGRYKGDLDVAVQAAASDSRVNVIQKPRIITSHATPGSIFIGSTVPYVTGSSYGGAYGSGNSYQQLKVGIGLQVTPFINPEGLVVMQIDENIEEISGSIEIQNVGAVPTTTTRTISAEVAVNDGDTILLGGFIRNSTSKSSSGVPLLKDIPLLGALFSSKSNSKERKELLVMMRPTVLKTPDIAALATTQEKKRLPGISAAEAEVNEQERQDLQAEEQQQAKRKAKAAAAERKANSKLDASKP
jgi:general secretion pathway protein D